MLFGQLLLLDEMVKFNHHEVGEMNTVIRKMDFPLYLTATE